MKRTTITLPPDARLGDVARGAGLVDPKGRQDVLQLPSGDKVTVLRLDDGRTSLALSRRSDGMFECEITRA